MSRFYNVRGFLDCDDSEVARIRAMVEDSKEGLTDLELPDDVIQLYNKGWLYQEEPINWVTHVFFGASMRLSGVELLQSQLTKISEAIPDIEGKFFVDDDEGEESFGWDVAGGHVVKVEYHRKEP